MSIDESQAEAGRVEPLVRLAAPSPERGAEERLFPNCFRCDLPFEIEDFKRQLIYCPECRAAIRAEREAKAMQAIREEIAQMEWPDIIE
jgi:hypothetical protein